MEFLIVVGAYHPNEKKYIFKIAANEERRKYWTNRWKADGCIVVSGVMLYKDNRDKVYNKLKAKLIESINTERIKKSYKKKF